MMDIASDQKRFLLSHLASLTLALPYRYVPQKLRSFYNLLPGLMFMYYCFGLQTNVFLLFATVSYIIFKYVSEIFVAPLSLASALAFLSYIHLSRQLFDYGGYTIDISGPFMIATQKVTSLGLCLYDGYRLKKKKVLTQEQQHYAVESVPSFGTFLGYFFHFPSVLCGPIMYYNDYRDFMQTPQEKELPPGRFLATIKKLTVSSTCTLLILYITPHFEIDFLRTNEFFYNTTLMSRFYFILIYTMLARLKYYVAWHLGEAAANLTGLGFVGYDENHKPKWDLISTMNIYEFETSLNFREAILAWNKTTQTWLRRSAYERVPKKFSVLATYTLSAVWHGFYPGYYLTFFSGALFTYAARSGRRAFRPFFQKSNISKSIYDAITFILTRITIAYIAFPFVILDFESSWKIYRSLYFSCHAFAIALIFIS